MQFIFQPITLLIRGGCLFNKGCEKIILTNDYFSFNLDHQNDLSHTRDLSHFRGAALSPSPLPTGSYFEMFIIEPTNCHKARWKQLLKYKVNKLRGSISFFSATLYQNNLIIWNLHINIMLWTGYSLLFIAPSSSLTGQSQMDWVINYLLI